MSNLALSWDYGRIDLTGNADSYDRVPEIEQEKRHQFRLVRRGNDSKRRTQFVMQRAHKAFVGNISFTTTEEDMKIFLEENADISVSKMEWIMDRETGRFRGFAFVSVESPSDMDKLVNLNGAKLDGRKLTVNEARPQTARG